MVTKQCPNCQQYVPVACKACPCGHIFFVARRAVTFQKNEKTDGEVKRRRTERTKRERPDYFSSSQIDNELKKMKKEQKSRKKSEKIEKEGNEKEGEGSNSEGSEAIRATLSAKNKKRGRPKKNLAVPVKTETKVEKDDGEDMFAKLSKEKVEQFSIILSEINRKMLQQQFRID